MSAYAKQADLEARYGADQLLQRLDRDGDGLADAGVLESAIASASAIVDSYISNSYVTPLQDPIDPAISEAVATMAWKFLWGGDATDQITDDFNRAERFLMRVAKGEANINHEQLTAASSEAPQFVGGDPAFTSDSMKGF